MAIEFYKEFGDLGYLASYSNHGFYINNIYYKTVEHYYQSEKFNDLSIKERIINAETPKEASTIGRDRKNIKRDDFNKLNTMYIGVLEKFRQNKDILYKLIETKDEEIIEKTTKENYWGIGPNNDGENHFGKILMQVRETLKKEILEKIIFECGKEVYVLGHNNPDADSIFSSYVMSNILKRYNIDAHFAILDKDYNYANSDKKLIEEHLTIKPEIINDITNKKFLLVDHNTLDGLDKSNVVGAIDHHIISNQVDNILEAEYASTGILIYDLFKECYDFSEEEKKLIGLTVLADTEYQCSMRYGRLDKKLYESLNLNINVNEYQKKYFVTTDFNNSIEENLSTSVKKYNNREVPINRYLICSYTKEKEENLDKYIKYLDSLETKSLLIWADYEEKNTTIYFEGNIYTLDYLTTSTYIVFKYLDEKKEGYSYKKKI